LQVFVPFPWTPAHHLGLRTTGSGRKRRASGARSTPKACGVKKRTVASAAAAARAARRSRAE